MLRKMIIMTIMTIMNIMNIMTTMNIMKIMKIMVHMVTKEEGFTVVLIHCKQDKDMEKQVSRTVLISQRLLNLARSASRR